MSVRHYVIPHAAGAACGVSLFIEGRRPTVTVVVTELPDNPGPSAREGFMTVVHKIRRVVQKAHPGVEIAWAYRVPPGDGQPEVLIRAHLDAAGAGVERWEHLNPAHLGQVVNRDGGFVRRGVFVPRFRPLREPRARHRPQEIVAYESA